MCCMCGVFIIALYNPTFMWYNMENTKGDKDMRKTKRFAAILLAAVLLGGCGESDEKPVESIENFEMESELQEKGYAQISDIAYLKVIAGMPEIHFFCDKDNAAMAFYIFYKTMTEIPIEKSSALVVWNGEEYLIGKDSVSLYVEKGRIQELFPEDWSEVISEVESGKEIEDIIEKEQSDAIEKDIEKFIKSYTENLQNTDDKEDEQYSEEVEIEKETSHLYDEEDLTIEKLGDIEYKIPKVFLENTKENGEWKYFYYQDLALGVCCSETTITNKQIIDNIDEFVESSIDNADNGKLIESKIVKTDVSEAVKMKMEQSVNGQKFTRESISFCRDSNFYTFMFMANKNSKLDYSEDFQRLTESITEKKLGSPLYEDERVKIYFKEIGESGVEFWVENLTDVNITIQADSVSINGTSSNSIIMSDDVAPQSKGKVIAKCDDFGDVSKTETVGGQLRIIDFDGSFESYKATFINVEVE